MKNIAIVGNSGQGKGSKMILFLSHIDRLKELGIKDPFNPKPEEMTDKNVSEVLEIIDKLNNL